MILYQGFSAKILRMASAIPDHAPHKRQVQEVIRVPLKQFYESKG